MKYKKTQIGWIIISILIPLTLFLYLAYAYQWGNNPILFDSFLLLTMLFLVLCAMFYKLTVELKESTLKLTYGIGLIRIKFKIDELKSVEKINTPWYYGLGIRITPKGMLYNIQGSKAVKIEYLRKGKRKSVMIGTPEPEKLIETLNTTLKNRQSRN